MPQYFKTSRNGQFLISWNIGKILKELDKKNISVTYYDVDYLASKIHGSVDTDYAMNTDITRPCIITLSDDGMEKLIDGSHRLYKAITLKIEKFY